MTTHFGTLIQITITAAILTIAANSEKAEAGGTKAPQVLIEAQIAEINRSTLREIGVDFRGLGDPYGYGYGTQNFELDALNAAERGSYEAGQNIRQMQRLDQLNQYDNGNYGQTNGNYDYNGLTSPAYEGLVRALDKNENTEVLSTPRVTTQDNQTATIQQDPNNTLHFNQNNVPSSIDLPTIDTRTVNTNVLVENGETVVLGGVYRNRENEDHVNSQVPQLGKIPYVSRLFKNNQTQEEERNLLIFVTPRITRNIEDE